MRLHSLVLLGCSNTAFSRLTVDIKAKEQSIKNVARGRKSFELPPYLSIAAAHEGMDVCPQTAFAVGLAQVDRRHFKGLISVDRCILALVGKNVHDLVGIPTRSHRS